MDVQTHEMPVDEAKKAYKEYREACKKHPNDDWLDTMRLLYKHMRKGRAVIDIGKVITEGGQFDDGMPKLGIARADLEIIHCRRRANGRTVFYMPGKHGYAYKGSRVEIPDFPTIENEKWGESLWDNERGQWTRYIDRQSIVPKIPAQFRPTHKLINYHILWEVDEWTRIIPKRAPGDPLLLKHIKGSMFAVLAAWDLTELERTVISGLLQNRN